MNNDYVKMNELKLYQNDDIIKVKDITDNLMTIMLNETLSANDTIKGYIHLSRVEEAIKKLKENQPFKKRIYECASKIIGNDKTTEIMSAEVSICAVKTSYDYTKCNHTEYNFIVSCIELLDLRKKAIEEELKLIPELEQIHNTTEVNDELKTTSEIIGGSKEIIVNGDILKAMQKKLNESAYELSEILTVKRPTVDRTIGVRINKK